MKSMQSWNNISTGNYNFNTAEKNNGKASLLHEKVIILQAYTMLQCYERHFLIWVQLYQKSNTQVFIWIQYKKWYYSKT